MPQRIDILDGGTIYYDESFYRKEEADALFDELRADTPWQQERGRMGPFPRLTAWYADTGLTYTYSGVTHAAIPWTLSLAEVRRRVEEAAGRFLPSPHGGRGAGGEGEPLKFNSVLLNYYRDGQDSMGYHTDDEPELGVNPAIASISLGAVRQFVLKHPATGEKLKYDLAHGSLLVMGGTCQHHWVHGVPKTKAAVGPRINLTFRNVIQV
jgi:alkylated DNA repair dioxygenase AlkB